MYSREGMARGDHDHCICSGHKARWSDLHLVVILVEAI